MTDLDPRERIPSVKLENGPVWEALLPRLEDLVRRGAFTLGPEAEEFEERAAEAFGTRWAVGTSSGTSALMLALNASGLEKGARVALPANTFYATLEAVVQAGAVPVVVDHDEDYLIDFEALAQVDVDAVVPVHLFGLPVEMTRLTAMADERGWWVLEDCSQAHGATVDGRPVGSFGHAGAFSAYPTKNLGAWGDAGFVTGSDPALERRIRSLRHHAQSAANVHSEIGGTERLDNLQALVLTEKLRRLPAELEARREVADKYRKALDGLELDLPGDRGDRLHAYHQFVVRVPERERIRADLDKAGIATSVHYPTPVHLQPGARGRCEVPVAPVRAERWSAEILSLPFFPSLADAQIDRVADELKTALRGARPPA